jgi:rhomboid protease GluP
VGGNKDSEDRGIVRTGRGGQFFHHVRNLPAFFHSLLCPLAHVRSHDDQGAATFARTVAETATLHICSTAMPALETSENYPAPSDEGDLVEVGVYGSASDAAERGLVVLAAGYPYWLAEAPEGCRLLVEREAVDASRYHLAAYEREKTGWPPPPITDPWRPRKTDLFTPLLWAVSVLAIFNYSMERPAWVSLGALRSLPVFDDGEWWRLVTALFLHADVAHVVSNTLSGLLVFSAVASTLGRARGWLLLLISAVLGNLAVAAVNYPGPYSSIGASTAIFAAVGLLTGRSIRVAWRSVHPHRWRAMFGPFAAGVTVLALHGAGGQRVDVGAHFTGFLAGLVMGFAAGIVRLKIEGKNGHESEAT